VWVNLHLRPACESLSIPVQYVEPPDQIEGFEDASCEWSILFLGSEGGGADGSDLEETLKWIARKNPLACVVAAIPSASLGRQVSLLRAGALEVLVLTANDKRLEETLERAIGLIDSRRSRIDDEKRRIINQLAISVNHEVNNPLTSLMATTELLLKKGKNLSDEEREDLKRIFEQSKRIEQVTARLRRLDHLRTIAYGAHDRMIDLFGELDDAPAMPPAKSPVPASAAEPQTHEAPETPPTPAQPPVPANATPAAAEQFLPTPSLLIVDDNQLIIELIARLFDQHYQIQGATSVTEALTKVARESFDLVLIDLIMPEMDGLAVFREIRKLRPDQKALLTTAYQGDARVEQAIVEGAVGCVYKPFEVEELERVINDALNGDADNDDTDVGDTDSGD
jgi:CheY-like chemotaxis protein